MRLVALLALFLLAACNPPATDRYVARIGMGERDAPSAPIASPDTIGAEWAVSPAYPDRLLYGKPGQRPLFALECVNARGGPLLTYTRFAPADAYAKAVLALIGNGHISRLKVDAARVGRAWLWRGSAPAASPDFESLTGGRSVEATIPGAGSLILNASALPGELIRRCRLPNPPADSASAPAAIGGPTARLPDTTGTAALPPLPGPSESE